MGKYLQDVWFNVQLPAGQKSFTEEQRLLTKATYFIGDLFCLYLPKKYEVGENIWRIIISLDLDGKSDTAISVSGLVAESKAHVDYDSLINSSTLERKTILLESFCNTLSLICQKYNCDFSVFEKIKHKLIEKKIVINGFYKYKKTSPDKQHAAQMSVYYSEEELDNALYVKVFDKHDNEKATILVGNYNFQRFDRLKWLDNKTIGVYHINYTQSYKRKKVAEDYYSIDIETGKVKYNPVTKESIFNYGVKLLTETESYEQAIHYIEQAQKLGHGKAENIFANLKIDPTLRDKSKLLQTPKKSKR